MPRRSLHALIGAALCGAFAALVWALVFRTEIGRSADEAAFAGFVNLQTTSAAPWADFVAGLCNTQVYAVLAGLLVVYALARRGPRWAFATAVVIVASNAATQILKPALAEPRMDGPLATGAHVVPASWPSGHSTAAMALALCAIMVAPPAARRLVAVAGGLFAVAVAYSVVLLGWHMPSDALGGFALAGAAAGVALAALWAAEARWPAGAGRRAAGRAFSQANPPGAGLIALVGLALVAAVMLRVASWLPGQQQQVAFLAIAAAIVALALALAAGVAGADRA